MEPNGETAVPGIIRTTKASIGRVQWTFAFAV